MDEIKRIFHIPISSLVRIRELRLWHWKQVLSYREVENEYKKEVANTLHSSSYRIRCQAISDNNKTSAGFHLKQVQTLNDFFDVGDTAERDCEMEKIGTTMKGVS